MAAGFSHSPRKPEVSCLPIPSLVEMYPWFGSYGSAWKTVHLLAGQKTLKDKYKDPNVLPKVSKSDMAGTIEAIKEYLRLCCGVVRAPLAYVIKKNIQVQTYSEYPKYATPDDKMIARMWHLPHERNKILLESNIQSTKTHKAEYKIDNRTVHDILNRSARTLTCIHMSKSISPRGMVKGHIMPSIPGG